MITSNCVKLGGHTLNVPSMKTWDAEGINDFWKSEQKQNIKVPIIIMGKYIFIIYILICIEEHIKSLRINIYNYNKSTLI